MKKITKALPEIKQIEVNGEIFDIKKGDIDILEKILNVQEKYADISSNDIPAIRKAIRSVMDFVDEILGEGAMKAITKGRPVGLVYAIELMTEIGNGVVEAYNENVKDDYE